MSGQRDNLIGQEFTTTSAEETEEVGEKCANRWTEPLAVALVGPLGSGKTTFTRGLLRGKGGDVDLARSPTFTLINRYENTTPTLIHADLYRAPEVQAQETIGLEEYFDRALVVVEWAGRWKLGWPDRTCTVSFEYSGQSGRKITVLEGPPDATGN